MGVGVSGGWVMPPLPAEHLGFDLEESNVYVCFHLLKV